MTIFRFLPWRPPEIEKEKWTELAQFVIGLIIGLLLGGYFAMGMPTLPCTKPRYITAYAPSHYHMINHERIKNETLEMEPELISEIEPEVKRKRKFLYIAMMSADTLISTRVINKLAKLKK